MQHQKQIILTCLKLGTLFLFLYTYLTASLASDHVDGPMTIKHPMADISDLFVFPSPNNMGHLVLILNVYPFVPASGHFADRVNYRFVARNISLTSSGEKTGFQLSEQEKIIDCSFVTPHRKTHWATCVLPHGESIRFKVNEDKVSGKGFKAFAGRRADPFLFNSQWFGKLVKEGEIPPANASNDLKHLNVLSIIFEIDVALVFGSSSSPLWAIAAETLTRDDKNTPPRRIDRVGRPELSNARLVDSDKTLDLRDLYNAEDTFKLDPSNAEQYRQRLLKNIAYYDNLDQVVDWPTPLDQTLANLLLNDFLVVDVTKPMSIQSYFDIENSLLRQQAHTRAGGRVPGDNIINALFTTMINAGHGREIANGIATSGKLAYQQFPYLRKPYRNPIAWVKSYIGRWAAERLATE